MRLSARPDTISQAISLYCNSLDRLPLQSLTPWMLFSRCYDFNHAKKELDWLTSSIRVLHGVEWQSVQELLVCAYLQLGEDARLRDAITGLCIKPALIGSNTLAAVLVELQGTGSDRLLACKLWSALLTTAGFAPSQTCIQMALKIALHCRQIDLAIMTYQRVLSGYWEHVNAGFWANKVMVYGLAINGMTREAFEVAAAPTTTTTTVGTKQTIQIYEVLLRGISKIQRADDAEAVFDHVRNVLGIWPTESMYISLLGTLASSVNNNDNDNWDRIEKYLDLMENEDGYSVPELAWKQILLGVAKQGRIDLCDHIIDMMASRDIPFTYVTVLAAINAFARTGDFAMVMRWWGQVIVKALVAQSQLPQAQQKMVCIDGTATHRGMNGKIPSTTVTEQQRSIQHPELFAEYFIQRNELVWHRTILVRLLNLAGEMGDSQLLMQMWDTICRLQSQVCTLKMTPSMYMVLAKSMSRLGMLERYEGILCLWIKDEHNGFSYSQQQEAIGFIQQCLRSNPHPDTFLTKKRPLWNQSIKRASPSSEVEEAVR